MRLHIKESKKEILKWHTKQIALCAAPANSGQEKDNRFLIGKTNQRSILLIYWDNVKTNKVNFAIRNEKRRINVYDFQNGQNYCDFLKV